MKKPIGIDLGTTNCCIAWMEGGQVVVYRDEENHSTIPSIVAQTPDNARLAGWPARNCEAPLYRHGFAKRSLGTTREFNFNDGPVSAVQISADLLRELKSRAEAAVKSEVAAVITVPAHFQQKQLEETRQAAQEAGLETLYLLPEPIAAAIAYYHEEDSRQTPLPPEETVLVYDLGGGTMDATVCVRRGKHIEVGASGKAFDGATYLGGVDFDKALVAMAAGQLQQQGFEAGTLGAELPSSQWLWELMTSAEDFKKRLSDEEEAQWVEDLVSPERQARLDLRVTRTDFEGAIEHLVKETLNYCDQALINHAAHFPAARRITDRRTLLKLAAEKLDRIILVGGSTLVPCIRKRVREHYHAILPGRERPLEPRGFKPFECVAIGAAIFAGSREWQPNTAEDPFIRWFSAPQRRIGEAVESHPELRGAVRACNEPGWKIELLFRGQSHLADLQADGAFRLPRLRLQPGENHFDLTVFDARGGVHNRQTRTIMRGGFSIGEHGLAHDICIRLVDGPQVFIPAGARTGTVHLLDKAFCINDRSGAARAPLYEGHYLIGELTFPTRAEPGTPVTFHTTYEPGKLRTEIRVKEESPQTREVTLIPVRPSTERDELDGRFRELLEQTEFLLERLPEEGQMTDQFRREWKALRLDIEIELANQFAFDINRIEDRLQQLELLKYLLQSFPATADGLRQRVRETRELATGEGCGDEFLQELDEIERKITDDLPREALAALDQKLRDLRRDFIQQHPPQITDEWIARMKNRIQNHLKAIRSYAGEDRTVMKKVRAIEETLGAAAHLEGNKDALFHHLWMLDQNHVNELYLEVVIRKGEEGLLRRVQ